MSDDRRETFGNRRSCPSARCEPGAELVGVVNELGQVDFLPQPLEVGETFVGIARAGRTPEKRFRFTSDCAEGGCAQWRDGHCTIVDLALERFTHLERTRPPAKCALRGRCRWFAQAGVDACTVCRLVVTDERRS